NRELPLADRCFAVDGQCRSQFVVAATTAHADDRVTRRCRHQHPHNSPAAQRSTMKGWRALGATGGFTLLEALIALGLMGIILGALATISSQWLPNWNRGIGRLQRQEHVALALERLSLDLAATEFIPLSGDGAAPYFDGRERSVTFIRTALSPNAKPALEIVRIAEEPAAGGPLLVRRDMPFRPVADIESLAGPFSDPVVLLRPPYRLAFAYAASPYATSTGADSAQSGEVLARAAAGAVNGPVWKPDWHQ